MTTSTVSRPVTVDTELAALYGKLAKAEAHLAGAWQSVHYAAGDKRARQYGTRPAWGMTPGQARTAAQAVADNDPTYRARGAEQALAALSLAEFDVAFIHAEIAPLNAEYAAAPWTRFFLVQGGHIHSSMRCSTCNNGATATTFGWLPALSGLTEADAVAAHGAILCTVCYPTAPVEWTNGREVEAAAKAAARCPGTGKYVPGNRRYVRCPDCSATVARTPSGLTRAHKPA